MRQIFNRPLSIGIITAALTIGGIANGIYAAEINKAPVTNPVVTGSQAEQDPYLAVKQTTEQLLAKLVDVKPLFESDPEKFFQEVDGSLGPFIDFEGFAKNVMAKYGRKATAAQKQAFAEKFRSSLIETYAKALLSFDNQKVEVVKSSLVQKKKDRAKILIKVYANDGAIYEVSYSLRHLGGVWKLRNLQIQGLNVGLQFRSQFKAAMDKYKQDIDAVIENWRVDGQ